MEKKISKKTLNKSFRNWYRKYVPRGERVLEGT